MACFEISSISMVVQRYSHCSVMLRSETLPVTYLLMQFVCCYTCLSIIKTTLTSNCPAAVYQITCCNLFSNAKKHDKIG